MKRLILKPFNYAAPGSIYPVKLEPPAEHEIDDDSAPGLEKEGYIAPLGAAAAISASSMAEQHAVQDAKADGEGQDPSWPPSEDDLKGMKFEALGVLLAGRGLDGDTVKALNSTDKRRDAVRDLIKGANGPAKPLSADEIAALAGADLDAAIAAAGFEGDALAALDSDDAKRAALAAKSASTAAPQ